MSSPSSIPGVLGTQAAGDLMIPDTTQKVALGTSMNFLDPYYGLQTLTYGKAAAIQETGSLTYFDNAWTATDIPNTANLGYPIAVAKAAMAANSYGWYVVAGLAPWSASASVAAGTAFGITGAGTCGANTAGKQILGARIAVASTGTFTRSVTTRTGSTTMRATSTAGMFVGLAISGTGIAGGSTIATIDPDEVTFTTNNAATGTATVTATLTYTGFLLVYANGAFGQGAIT